MNIDEPEQIMSQKFLTQGRQLTSAPVHCSYVSQDHDLVHVKLTNLTQEVKTRI